MWWVSLRRWFSNLRDGNRGVVRRRLKQHLPGFLYFHSLFPGISALRGVRALFSFPPFTPSSIHYGVFVLRRRAKVLLFFFLLVAAYKPHTAHGAHGAFISDRDDNHDISHSFYKIHNHSGKAREIWAYIWYIRRTEWVARDREIVQIGEET